MTQRSHSDAGSRSRLPLSSISFFVIVVLLLSFFSFIWGMSVVRNKTFPYVWIADTHSAADDAKQEEVEQYARDRLWAKKIVSGGYILHFRHAQREKWADVTAFDAYELKRGLDASQSTFSKATCLTPQGVEEATLIGNVFELTGLAVSEVVSSPSCRARQTALLAFGRIDSVDNSLLHRTAMMREQHSMFARQLRKLIENIVLKPGQNVVLSGHGGTLSYDGAAVIDIDETGGIDERDETGFVVIEHKAGKLIARHKFKSIRNFANAMIELPPN
jgi:broad specificity phosphatase PhoE